MRRRLERRSFRSHTLSLCATQSRQCVSPFGFVLLETISDGHRAGHTATGSGGIEQGTQQLVAVKRAAQARTA
jgi:hypothetical protein